MIAESSPDKRAPEPLRFVQQFVNTAELDEDAEDLTSPEALRDWMAERDLADPKAKVTDADLQRALEVREGLRAVLYTHNGGDRDQDALDLLERAAGRASLRATFADCSPRLTPAAKGTDAGLAQAAGDRRPVRRRRHLGPAQGVRGARLPLGVLRQVEEPLGPLVLDGDLREPPQDPSLPRTCEGLRRADAGLARAISEKRCS